MPDLMRGMHAPGMGSMMMGGGASNGGFNGVPGTSGGMGGGMSGGMPFGMGAGMPTDAHLPGPPGMPGPALGHAFSSMGGGPKGGGMGPGGGLPMPSMGGGGGLGFGFDGGIGGFDDGGRRLCGASAGVQPCVAVQ